MTKDYVLLADYMKKHGAVEASVRELNVQVPMGFALLRAALVVHSL